MARPFRLHNFAYAHRGLWAKDGLPENSLGAFRAAAEAGLGIEFDVRPSSDGEIIAFHDPDLTRMTGHSGTIENLTADELKSLTLKSTAEPIPTLEDLLGFWPEHLPLLCEMKIDGATDPADFAARVGARLENWPGLAAAMSFSEKAVRALPAGLMKGQLVAMAAEYGESYFNGVLSRAITDDIDYLAVHVTDVARTHTYMDGRKLPFVTWTVQTREVLEFVAPYGPAIIFEHISPALVLDTLRANG